MAKIQVLDKHVSELIAAGEVVERPSSVIKELFENAVDAGATSVTVEIRNGGVTYMSITDNGCGIAREDVPTAFLRHATSKVRTEEDLTAIGTLGFRGEALASVAAVSRVELLTSTEEESVGTRYGIEGGVEVYCEDAARPRGTTLVVRDLFYNVPARMKFLKKDVGEGNAVSAVLERLALSHPEISVRYVRDGREEFLTPGNGELKSAIYTVMGKDFTSGLIPLKYSLGGITVTGYICKPTYSRANRAMQHFYINGRYVKSKTMMAALEQAYKGSLMVGRFPTCVLMMTVSPEVVDANVHPAKMEVRFINEKPIFDAVYYGIKTALQAGDSRIVSKPAERPAATAPTAEQLFFRTPETPAKSVKTDFVSVSTIKNSAVTALEEPAIAVPPVAPFSKKAMVSATSVSSDMPLRDSASVDGVIRIPAALRSPVLEQEKPPNVLLEPAAVSPVKQETASSVEAIIATEPEKPLKLVGEAFETYIFAEYEGVLYCIDKHAAHERLLYNELISRQQQEVQLLLAPVSVPLKKEEFGALIDEKEALFAAGFEVEDFGDSTLLVRSVPMMLTGCDIVDVMQEIAGGLLSGRREITTNKQEWIFHSTACRAAIKAGAKSQPRELEELARRVLQNDDVRYCPHGRPVCIHWSRSELEKLFGRV